MGSTVTDALLLAFRGLSKQEKIETLDWYDAIKSKRYPWGYIRCLIDRHRSGLTLEDAYEFQLCSELLSLGLVARRDIYIGCDAGKDSAYEYNNKILSTLPHPFSGYFQGGASGSDGDIKWSEPIKMALFNPKNENFEPYYASPTSVGLEVGTIIQGKMFSYFAGGIEGRGVARWAYGDKHLRIFYPTDKFMEQVLGNF